MLTKFAQWWLKKKQEQMRKQALNNMEKERIIIYQNYQNLLRFIEIMNKQVLVNRHAKRVFWSQVEHGKPILEEYIKEAMSHYKSKLKITTPETNIKKESENTQEKQIPE